MKKIFIYIFIFLGVNLSAQIDYSTGWKEQNLKHKPKKVSISHVNFTEKFGEPVEEKLGIEELTFNLKGQYLEKSTINLSNKDKNETTTYQYDANTGNLIIMDYDAEYFMTADYSYKYEWVNGLISKKIITIHTHGTHHIEYKYDNQGRNIEEIIYDNKDNLSEIWRYQYDGSQPIEAKQYDNTGTLRRQKKWTYDLMKNLIRFEEYVRNNDEMEFNVDNKYKYNKHQYIIEDENCNYYSEWKCYKRTFAYEYYPNGLIKKRTEYGKDIKYNTIIGGIVEYKSYDNFKNWTEKVIWSSWNNPNNEWQPSEKFVREIEYY